MNDKNNNTPIKIKTETKTETKAKTEIKTKIEYCNNQPETEIIIGIDRGALADFTAFAVVKCYHNEDDKTAYQVLETRQFKLHTPYSEVINALVKLDESIREEIRGVDLVFIAETNGVGLPVIERFRESIENAEQRNRIYEVFTSGGEAVNVNGKKFTAGKKRMITNLSGMVSVGRLTFKKQNKALVDELQNFRGFQLESGKEEYEAKTGAHDDIIMALSFCVLLGEQREQRRKYQRVPFVAPVMCGGPNPVTRWLHGGGGRYH